MLVQGKGGSTRLWQIKLRRPVPWLWLCRIPSSPTCWCRRWSMRRVLFGRQKQSLWASEGLQFLLTASIWVEACNLSSSELSRVWGSAAQVSYALSFTHDNVATWGGNPDKAGRPLPVQSCTTCAAECRRAGVCEAGGRFMQCGCQLPLVQWRVVHLQISLIGHSAGAQLATMALMQRAKHAAQRSSAILGAEWDADHSKGASADGRMPHRLIGADVPPLLCLYFSAPVSPLLS